MIYIPDEALDRMIQEDVPYLDLTTWVLGFGPVPGRMEYFTRQEGILCGTEEAGRILGKLGVQVTHAAPSGHALRPGEIFLTAEGPADAIHMGWKVTQSLLEYCSGIATKTKRVVEAVHSVNPRMPVVTTRKSFPGAKQQSVKAILAGGAFPHRLGLSETVLVFGEHIAFLGGLESFMERIPDIKSRLPEKKLLAETQSLEEAWLLAGAGVDALQFDKLPPEQLRAAAAELKAGFPGLILLAAGGIDEHNAAEYASAGVDALVTTSLFSAKPMDMSVRITPR
ncbi:MAG: molybdenum utilization protein ModD [Paenibacillaceae bacterium]|jgi:molybdenum transport protein|nr:molybdenum utilization protein ModD [Paenibacillaceae bacterium]